MRLLIGKPNLELLKRGWRCFHANDLHLLSPKEIREKVEEYLKEEEGSQDLEFWFITYNRTVLDMAAGEWNGQTSGHLLRRCVPCS